MTSESTTHPTTSFARLGRGPARCALIAFVVFTALSVAITFSPLAKGFADKPSRGPSDIALYKAEADRMHAGESYYPVANEELRQRGYPTRSVFNWRTPLPMWLIAVMPDPILGKTLLGLLGLALLLTGFSLCIQEGGKSAAITGGLALCGALFPCLLGDLFYMPVLWAGTLIALSATLLALGKTRTGVAAGIGAVFVRDLAGPYCVFSFMLALAGRRFREAVFWAAGLAAYAVFFVWHVQQVGALQTGSDAAHAHGWVQFGGLAFVISAAQMNGFLVVLPQWVTAIYFVAAILGFASWSSPAGRRIGLCTIAYVVLFGFVGQDFNQYWGSLIAPLLALGLARAPLALADLWRAARRQSVSARELTMASSSTSPA